MLKDELVIQGRFEWFRDNDKENIQKHGFSFEQILDVFDDPYFYEIYDSDHSDVTQDRYFGLGCTNSVAIMATNYAENKCSTYHRYASALFLFVPCIRYHYFQKRWRCRTAMDGGEVKQ